MRPERSSSRCRDGRETSGTRRLRHCHYVPIGRPGPVDVRDYRKTGDDGLRLKSSAYGKEYSRRCKAIAGNVDEVAASYVRGRYDRKRYWRSIYLGKAGYKEDKKNLRKRILEELKDERAFVWRYIYDETEVGLRLAKIGYEGQKVVELKYKALSKF